MTMSLSFDAIAGHFDDQRGLPIPALRALVSFVNAMGGGTPMSIIEPGVGTGRIALPLAMAGHHVTGVDISRPMLDACRAKAAAMRVGSHVALMEGDATALPAPDDRFDLGMFASLLYLVPAWEQVLDELDRVVRPGGAVMMIRERTEPGEALRRWDAAWRSRIEATGFRHQSLSPTDDKVKAAMHARWGTVTVHEMDSWTFGQSVAQARRDYGDRLRPLYPSINAGEWDATVRGFLEWARQDFGAPASTVLEGVVHFELVVSRT
jgi:ubiquinone/menaquinone biosynthesis C-methylase UbiE